ncbi:MAG: hypothetical protein ACO3F2_04470 [Roseiflexaceae bacterium]
MNPITLTIQHSWTISAAHAHLAQGAVARVVTATGRSMGIVDTSTLWHAIESGYAEDSLTRCMWQLPTRSSPVYTPTFCIMRMHNGYVWHPIVHAPSRSIPWQDVYRALPETIWRVLTQVAQVASAQHAQLYVVGGAVRSVVQSEPITDLDVAMNGDMAVIGPTLADYLGTTILQRSAFDTATLAMPDDVIGQTGITYIDIVPLRTETYVHPGALPVVTPTSSIVIDLGRRDLTINAMAIGFRPHEDMLLYDPFAGEADLAHQCARILHPLSFIDDPTRVVRMARLMVRLGLGMDTTTQRALRWAVASGVMMRVSRQRWIQEVYRMLDEANPQAICVLLRRWGVLAQIDAVFTHGVASVVTQLSSEWRILAMIWQAPIAQLADFMARWHDAPKPMRGVVALRQTRRQWYRLRTALPSQIARYLRQFDRRLLQQVAYIEPQLVALLHRVDMAHDAMTPMYVRGGDLIRLGVPAGPVVGHLLQALNDALLDGNALATYDVQVAWLKEQALWHTR